MFIKKKTEYKIKKEVNTFDLKKLKKGLIILINLLFLKKRK